MKKLLLIALTLCTLAAVGQNKVGFNASNAAESFTTLADSNYLLELVPEGGTFSWRDRYDKLNESPEQIISLYKFMQKHNRSFWIIFVAADSIPLQQNIDAIAQLKAAGVPVLATSFVNEPFYLEGGYDFNWPKYEAVYLPFCEAITSNFPDVEILLPIAPKPLSIFTKEQGGQSKHDLWNDAGVAFKNAHPQFNIKGGDVHVYYTGAFVEVFGKAANTDETGKNKVKIVAPAERVYNYQTDTIDEKYWRDVFYQCNPSLFWEPMLNYLQSKGLSGYVTECGFIDAGALNGSWSYAAKAFELVSLYGDDPRISSFNWHGGPITQSGLGVVGPRKKWDIRELENPNNCASATFDAFCMYFYASNRYEYFEGYTFSEPGTYYLWYQTENGFTPSYSVGPGLQATHSVTYITGNRFGSLSRSMDFTKKGSILGNEVNYGTGQTCPDISFGYVIVTVITSDVPGCTDENALNFNPNATVDDGSCIARVYGCMDPAATNFNPDANTDNGMCVIITVKCYQKRWLFKSLPCKEAKRNCNCND